MAEDRIERIELHHVSVPLPTPIFPVWIPGHAVTALASTLLVVKTREGRTGLASGPAFGRERSGLGAFIEPFLIGADPMDVDGARERLRQAAFLGWRNNWMDIAFWDLAAQARDIPIHALLAERLGAPPGPAPDRVVAFASFQELRKRPARMEAVERALRAGFRGVKIGVHHRTEAEDFADLDATRAAAGPATELYVHAHQAWSVALARSVPQWTEDRALRFSARAAELGYARVQEPLYSDDWGRLAALRAEAGLPVAGGDLSVSAAQLRNLARLRCYDILTPAVGFAGLGRLEVAMAAARDSGLDFSPMTYWDGIEVTCHLHALAAWARVRPGAAPRLALPWEPPAQMPEYRDAILREPLSIDEDGTLAVPTAPGLGVELDGRALERFSERFFVSTPVRLLVSSARRSGLRQTAEIAGRPRDGTRSKPS